jgi:hypothetical protein
MYMSSAFLITIIAGQAFAQPEITLTKIAGPDTQVHVLGNRPAMHNGTIAFYGYSGAGYGDNEVIATVASDGTGPFQILVNEGDSRPDRPGEVFAGFGNPEIFNGLVLFFGVGNPGFPSTYSSDNGGPYELYLDAGINDPFLGSFGLTSNASNGTFFRENDGTEHFLGIFHDPFPCGVGEFSHVSVPGLRFAPQAGHYIIWPARMGSPEFISDSSVVAYDINTDTLNCVATPLDMMPNYTEPFDFFYKATTNGELAVFIGYEPGFGFDRHEGVYIRDISGTGPIIKVADRLTESPSGGNFGIFENVSIDGNLIIFEGCSGGNFSCDRYGIYGCFLDNGVPGEIFDILNTSQTIDGRQIIDITLNQRGQDGNQVAFDIRHGAQSASLYVATITPPGVACPPDLTNDGVLDFFDVSAFLSLFSAQDPAGDWNSDGLFDFFDVQQFLDDFAVGCP